MDLTIDRTELDGAVGLRRGWPWPLALVAGLALVLLLW
jgi:hypothetical protein